MRPKMLESTGHERQVTPSYISTEDRQPLRNYYVGLFSGLKWKFASIAERMKE